MTKKEPIPIQNLFYMLCYAWNVLSIKDSINVSSEKIKDTHNLLGRLFSYSVGKLIRQGFHRSYVITEDELSTLKGKILLANTINQSSLVKKKLYCEFDDFTSNNLFNQIIKYTLCRLIKNPAIDISIKNDVKKQIIYFANIDEAIPNPNNLQKLKFNKNNFIYRLLISIAIMLYNNTLVNENEGRVAFNDFYREEQMQKVYELFLLNFYTLHLDKENYHVHAPKINWNIDTDAFDYWQNSFEIETKITDRRADIVIENKKEKIQFIIDAKYYKEALISSYQNETIKTYRTGHINQVRGYILDSSFEGTKCGALVYPTVCNDELERGKLLPISGAHIIMKTINLNQDWQKIEEDLLYFAKKVVK
jgi:5-methylcytosine-specific restriction enzyme subunit McrC